MLLKKTHITGNVTIHYGTSIRVEDIKYNCCILYDIYFLYVRYDSLQMAPLQLND